MNEGIFSLVHGLYQLYISNGLHTKIKRGSPQSGWIPWMSALVMCRILFRLDFLMAGLPVGGLTAGWCRDAGRISWLASCLLCLALFSVVLWSIFSGFPESILTSRKEQETFFFWAFQWNLKTRWDRKIKKLWFCTLRSPVCGSGMVFERFFSEVSIR